MLTRPEPTIIGNCEGWSFIVGKKPGTYSPRNRHHEALPCSNKNFIHNLLTILANEHLDNLWVNCGPLVGDSGSSRIVDYGPCDMPVILDHPCPF